MSTNLSNLRTIEALTDLGNSNRFNTLSNNRLMYVKESKCWYRWNGAVWEVDGGQGEREGVLAVIAELQKEAQAFQNAADKAAAEGYKDEQKHFEEQRAAVYAAELKLQSERGYGACVRLAAKNEAVYRSIEEFDSKGQFIGVANGIVNLYKGTLIQDDPSYLITNGDKDRAAFLQRVAGQCLLGTKKDRILIFTGVGANGKSTYVQTLRDLMGSYAKVTDAKMLISDKGPKEYYMAELKGARMVTMSETSVESHMARDLVKNLVDSEGISARKPRGEVFDVMPIMTPILSTNHVPTIGNDTAVWRRVYIVKFSHIIPLEKRDPNFVDKKLKPEFSGILNWAIEGAKQYLEQGLNPPQSVLNETMAERAEQDSLQQFIDQFCIVGEDKQVEATAFRKMYVMWRQTQGQREVGSKTLNAELRSKGFIVDKCPAFNNGNAVFGLALPKGLTLSTEYDLVRQLGDLATEEREGKGSAKIKRFTDPLDLVA